MVNKKLIKVFEEKSQKAGLNVKLNENETIAGLTFEMENTKIKLCFFFEEGKSDVQIMALNFVKIPGNKAYMGSVLANKYNKKYRWAKFLWEDANSELIAEYDMEIEDEDDINNIFANACRICEIIDEAYPDMVKDIRDDAGEYAEFSDNKSFEGTSLDEMLQNVKNYTKKAC